MLKSPWIWIIAGICLVILACLVWFFVKGGKRLRNWLQEPVEPNKPRWTYALTPLAAAVAPLAAFSVLLPSYFTQQQSDRKFMTEAGRSRTDAEWHRLRLDTDTQAPRFAEVETRFGSPNAQTRAVAALQLADLAQLPKPSAGSGSDAFDDDSYPFFALTGVQLAMALQMEPDPDVRAAHAAALRKLVAFAAEKKNPVWQYQLANELADANRRTKQVFSGALARYAAASDVRSGETLRVLSTVAPLTPQMETTIVVLNDLMAPESFQAQKRVATRLREASTGEQRRTANASLLANVQTKGAHLVDSRDALADALRVIQPVSGSGSGLEPVKTLLRQAQKEPKEPKEQSKPTLQLRDCFLAGADLRRALLNNAEAAGASFRGANLAEADLSTANVEAASSLPPSVTKSSFGANSERVQVLMRKYPRYDWTAAERQVLEARRKRDGQTEK